MAIKCMMLGIQKSPQFLSQLTAWQVVSSGSQVLSPHLNYLQLATHGFVAKVWTSFCSFIIFPVTYGDLRLLVHEAVLATTFPGLWTDVHGQSVALLPLISSSPISHALTCLRQVQCNLSLHMWSFPCTTKNEKS